MRKASVKRETKETKIEAELQLDGRGGAQIATGIGFFDHLLTTLAFNAGWNLRLVCKGDLGVDEHHTVEDAGIVLGEALRKALAEAAIERYGFFILPMDEALATVALDVGGRPFMKFEASFSREKVGDFPTELTEDFLRAFCNSAGATLYAKLEGRNEHHKLEALFKALGRALRIAAAKRKYETSTKGGVIK